MQVITFRHPTDGRSKASSAGSLALSSTNRAHIESGAVRARPGSMVGQRSSRNRDRRSRQLDLVAGKEIPNRSVHVHDGIVPLTAICIVVLCSPLFSPQYLLWLTPFAAIAWTRRRSAATTLIAIAVILTVLHGAGYVDLTNGHTGAETLLVARNFTLLAVVALGFRETRARSPVPEPSAELSSDVAPCM